jgi:flagellar hook-associated protein 2
MGSVSSSSSTLASNINTIATPQSFTGVSQYSSDLQSVLARAEQIEQIPLETLQNDQTTIQDEATALGTLQSSVGSLTTALNNLGTLSANGALSGSSSDSNAGITLSGSGASPGTYTISNVTSLASESSATMTNAVADASSTAVAPTGTNTLYLVAGNGPVAIQLTSATNNLNGLSAAINATNAGVTSSVITTSNGSYLTLNATTAGATQLELLSNENDPTTNLMTMSHTGSVAQFDVDGKPTTSTSNQVAGVIPGATIDLNATFSTNETATLTIAPNAAPLETALQNVATAYNGVLSELATQTGASAGPLGGNSILGSIRSLMSEFTFYSASSGSVSSLMDLGVSINEDGTMSVDNSVLSAMAPQQLGDALKFIGDGTQGLSAMAQSFDNFSDTASGVIQQDIAQDNTSVQNLSNQITDMSTRISSEQAAETSKLEAADAALAELENQQTTLSASIQSLDYTLYGVNTTTSAP